MACKLRSVPPVFEGAAGQRMKLFVKDQIGTIMIVNAEYNGQQLAQPNQGVKSIEFGIVSGTKTLKIVFAATAGAASRGELREDCGDGDSHFVRAIVGHEPFQALPIVGRPS